MKLDLRGPRRQWHGCATKLQLRTHAGPPHDSGGRFESLLSLLAVNSVPDDPTAFQNCDPCPIMLPSSSNTSAVEGNRATLSRWPSAIFTTVISATGR